MRSADKLVDDIVCDRELLALLFKALHALTEDERSLITAMFFEEKTSREIAAHTGIPQSTILYRKNKILQKMKKIFD